MQDKAIAQIGRWQLEQCQDMDPVDLLIENMFPGKDYRMLLLVFEVTNSHEEIVCEYKCIDIENVNRDSTTYRKYAYRKGSARGGDITLTTKLSFPAHKKLQNIKDTQLKKLISPQHPHADSELFKMIEAEFIKNEEIIRSQIDDYFNNATKEWQTATGISLRVFKEKPLYLNDFESVRQLLLESGSEKKYDHNGTQSRHKNAVCSVTGEHAEDVYGFAGPFKYSSPDKRGFISGFFNKTKFWRTILEI